MAQAAKVESIDALRTFRAQLLKFAERCSVALSDAEGELHRTQIWLESEQTSYWTHQAKKRMDIVMRCKEALRMKKLYKDVAGGRSSAVDEQKALDVALKRFEEAERKLAAVKKYRRVLDKETLIYKGSVQRFATAAQVDMPMAAEKLGRMIAALEAYVAYGPAANAPSLDAIMSEGGATAGAASMARAADSDVAKVEPFARLRNQTPLPAIRAAAARDDATADAISSSLTAEQRDELIGFASPDAIPSQAQTLTISTGVSQRLYLERVEALTAEDAG